MKFIYTSELLNIITITNNNNCVFLIVEKMAICADDCNDKV